MPVRLASACWQTVCQNKKTIAKVTAGVAAVAIAAILYNQKQSLDYMQDSLIKVADSAKGMENTIQGGGMTIGHSIGYIGPDVRCMPFSTPYKLEVELSKSTPDITGLFDQVKALYNNATSYGTDLFSRYGFHATRDAVVQNSDKVKATFLICRSSLSNLVSSPWCG